MMKRQLFLFLLLPVRLFAGGDNYPIGARSAGIAHASVTLQDIWSAANNQAGLAWIEKNEAAVYYENKFLISELGLASAVFASPTKFGTFALSYRQFGTSVYNENKIGLGYSMKLGEKFSAGIQINYQTIQLGEFYGKANALTAEIGMMTKLNDNLTMGVHLFNPTRASLSENPVEFIPTTLRTGLNYSFSEKIFVAAEIQKDIDNPLVFKTGIEYRVHEIFALRGGISTQPVLNTFGFGLYMKNFTLDLAAGYHQVLGISSQVGISYKFGSDKPDVSE